MNTDQLISFTLLPASFLGVLSNLLVVIATWRSRSLSHSFQLLTANQAVFDCVHSMVFLFYITPMAVTKSAFFVTHFSFSAYILMFTLGTGIQAHFLISLNRLCAVYTPITYRIYFSLKWTRSMIIASCFLSFCLTIFFMKFVLSCIGTFVPETWEFSSVREQNCVAFLVYSDIGKVLVFSISGFLLDLMTVWKARKAKGVLSKDPRNQKRELEFIKQSFSQSLLMVLFVIGFFLTPHITDSKTVFFVVGCVSWILLHSLNGVFTIYFNSVIRKSLRCSTSSKASVISMNRKITVKI